MAVEQANDRSPAVGSANLQPLTLFQLHTQPLFRVDAAIGNLNDRVVGLIGMPLLPGSPELQSGGNAMKIAIAFLADAQQVIGIGLEKRTIVLTAADIGAKGIVIHDPHSPLRSIARREGNPPQHGINGHFVFLRVIPPVRQVGSDNVCSVYRLPVDSALAWRRRRRLRTGSFLLRRASAARTPATSSAGRRRCRLLNLFHPEIEAFILAIIVLQAFLEETPANGRREVQ